MTDFADRFARDLYRGVWGFLVPLLRVPQEPPDLPSGDRDQLEVFHPSPGFLKYLKLWFWIVVIVVDLALLVAWVATLVVNIVLGLALLPVFVVVMFVPDVIAFIAIHLRYDTTWYAMTDRAIRIRRGVWTIRETTISFENIQNVKVSQGPVQRAFGISNVALETAGSGGGQQSGHGGSSITNKGVIEGVSDAKRLRDVILARVRQSKSAGLGDEAEPSPPSRAPAPGIPGSPGSPGTPAAAHPQSSPRWPPAHLALLREIRDAVTGAA